MIFHPCIQNQLKRMDEDSRISPVHISLFISILRIWEENSFNNPISFFRTQLMSRSKISGIATYYRVINELDEYGYIRYKASYNRFTGSLIYIHIKQLSIV